MDIHINQQEVSSGFWKSVLFLLILTFIVNYEVAFPQNFHLIDTLTTQPIYANDIEIAGDNIFLGGGRYSGTNLIAIDISDPTNIQQIGQLSFTGRILQFCLVGNYLYAVVDTNPRIRIVDISDPSNLIVIGTYDDSLRAFDICVSGHYAYVGEGYDKKITVIDIENPANPTFTARFSSSGYAWKVLTSANYLYVRGDHSIEIFDISDPMNVAYVNQDNSHYVYDMFVKDNYLFAAFSDAPPFSNSSYT